MGNQVEQLCLCWKATDFAPVQLLMRSRRRAGSGCSGRAAGCCGCRRCGDADRLRLPGLLLGGPGAGSSSGSPGLLCGRDSSAAKGRNTSAPSSGALSAVSERRL